MGADVGDVVPLALSQAGQLFFQIKPAMVSTHGDFY
jgi:hypothetical protein